MKSSTQFAQKCREEALRKYQDEVHRFNHQVIMVVFYKVKSLLSTQGYKKVCLIDKKRAQDINFDKELKKRIWESTEDLSGQLLGQLMKKIAAAYGLKMGEDLIVEFPHDDDDDFKYDFFI